MLTNTEIMNYILQVLRLKECPRHDSYCDYYYCLLYKWQNKKYFGEQLNGLMSQFNITLETNYKLFQSALSRLCCQESISHDRYMCAE